MFNLGFGKSSSSSRSSTRVWEAQDPFLRDMYARGAGLLDQFQPNMGLMDAWQNQLQPQGNPYLQQMSQFYQDQLGQMNQGTGRAAAAAGMFGGGRQGVEQSLNQQQMGTQLGQFLGNQYQSDMNRSMQALQMGNSMTPYGQQMGALRNFASLIGPPVMLNQSRGRSNAFNMGGGLSDFGGLMMFG